MNHQLKISHPNNGYSKVEVLGSYYMLEDSTSYHFVDKTRHVILSITDIINMFEKIDNLEKRVEELEKKQY